MGLFFIKGFHYGVTISFFSKIFGITKGLIFVISALSLQNILYIPSVLAIGVSGVKLYKAIVKNKQKNNIKVEIFRHTIFSIIMILVIIVGSIVESFISTELLKLVIKYF